jgi:hypothetical protein
MVEYITGEEEIVGSIKWDSIPRVLNMSAGSEAG